MAYTEIPSGVPQTETVPIEAFTTPCHDLTHGPSGGEVVPRLHHHDTNGARFGHARFGVGSCLYCRQGMTLHDAPTPDPIFPDQTCVSCGAEHPGEPCSAYEADLFGGVL